MARLNLDPIDQLRLQLLEAADDMKQWCEKTADDAEIAWRDFETWGAGQPE
jgi:hypothetical protein